MRVHLEERADHLDHGQAGALARTCYEDAECDRRFLAHRQVEAALPRRREVCPGLSEPAPHRRPT